MKTLKFLLVALILSLSTTTYAEKNPDKIFDLKSLSEEIENLLRKSKSTIQEGETITLFFSVSEDKTMQFVNVASTDRKISELLEKKLQHQKLEGNKWREGMIYELSIEGRGFSTDCIVNF
ncbi:hypothetical protein [Salinimicrobium xinjiangense]|uniref:hypothetical protein n=1 Tax=Salinimicrobium xinjiangense TaxID=438596 RepID=UPI0003F4FDFD|nr:hypothetical protein [Salinimicrobium xinjiangense]